MQGNFPAQHVQRTSKGFPDRSLLIQAKVYFQRRTSFVANIQTVKYYTTIDNFTVFCSVTWPLDGSEAGGDLVLIQTSLLLLCKSSCSDAN